MLKGPKPRPIPRNLRLMPADAETNQPEKPKLPKLPDPPSWLDGDAQEIYRAKSAQIQAAGYWRELFGDALAVLASLLAEYRRNPAGISAAKLTQLRLLLSELGLTPQSARGVTK